jgi:hypothetical protein
MLMQYMAAAKGGNKNVSSISNNLSDPVLLALAGVLDPYYGAGDSSTTYGQFANDPSTPAAVRAVMDYVDQGMNQYQIEAQINNLDDDVIKDSGYTDDMLISIGRDMVKEGGKKGSNVFTKAGLRNPNDVYTEADVPLNENVSKMLKQQGERRTKVDKNLTKASDSANKAKKKLGPLYGKDFTTPELLAYLKNDPEASKLLKGKNIDWDKVDPNTGQIYSGPLSGTAQDTSWQQFTPWGALYNVVDKGVTEVGRTAEIIGKENIMGGKAKYISDVVGYKKPVDPYDLYEYEQAQLDVKASKIAQERFDRLEQATRRGALKRVAEKGQTPFTDQTSTLLKFIAGTK